MTDISGKSVWYSGSEQRMYLWPLSGKRKENVDWPVNICNQDYKTGIYLQTLYQSWHIKHFVLKLYYKYRCRFFFFNLETRCYLLVVCYIKIFQCLPVSDCPCPWEVSGDGQSHSQAHSRLLLFTQRPAGLGMTVSCGGRSGFGFLVFLHWGS